MNGAWRLMTSDEQAKFVRYRKKELPTEAGDINFEFEQFSIVRWEIDSAGQALPVTTDFGRPSSYGFAIQFPDGRLRVHDIYPQTKFDNWEAFASAMRSFASEDTPFTRRKT